MAKKTKTKRKAKEQLSYSGISKEIYCDGCDGHFCECELSCENCGDYLDDIGECLCLDDGHFCNEDCLKEWRKEQKENEK
jgi:hypothetical protein